ncbi:hypothetical protein [Argonema galeatum]|uniref:hypothetical protein n=1 Tax=Argonema galeatum TaxID=2942762 RepID=UPI002010E688|nr:hypothetical protein [Argonema galeatum]MCL1463068.1 hypothetical protein [Argonema galeatum A003/A1]
MTPEAIRIVDSLRREFYSLFAAAMKVPVKITGNSYSSNFPTASWLDNSKRLNYVNIYAYTAPDHLIPERPFILRVAINKGAGRIRIPQWGQECRGFNQGWHFELTLLPEEILDFLPWIVSLIKSHDKGSPPFADEPPHPFELKMYNGLLSNNVWTEKAWQLQNREFARTSA